MRTTSFSKTSSLRTLPAHNVHMYYARTPVEHCVHECVVCPLWGAFAWGLQTWGMEVVELREVKKGGLIALVQGRIKVVVVFVGHIACRTSSFLCGLKKSVEPLPVFGALPGGLQWRQDLRSLVCARVSLLSFISHHNNMTSKLSSRIDPLLERMESIILRVEQITDSTCRRNGRPVAKAAISQKLDIPGTNLSRHLRESLTPVQQQICNSVLSNSSILPSIETLCDTYHPCVSLYIKPVNIVRSVLACNSKSALQRAALMADIYSTTALTEDAQLCGYNRRFTMAHAMVSCGYDPLDVPVYGPIIDESFYRMIAGNVKMYHYTIDSPKISLFRGSIYQELLDMWLN